MAGAGPVQEKLVQIKVAEILCEGGRFMKWEDDGESAIYHVEVDPKGHVLFWYPEDYSRDTDVLDLVHIRDVRTGIYAKTPKNQDLRLRESLKEFCAFDAERENINERTVTVVYGPNFVDITFINFVASSISEAEEWTKELFSLSNNLLETNSSSLKCLEIFHTRICVQQNQEGQVPAKLLVKHFTTSKDDKKRAFETLQSVGLSGGGGKAENICIKDFTFEKFLAFYSRLVRRHDLDIVFAELGAKNKPYLTIDQLVEFLNGRQRDPRLNEILFPYFNNARAQQIIANYEPNQEFAKKGV
jgi:phosphatidylinositol phospholipase C beta